ncbi:hypothetical protein LCGC14_0840600, partial [marine sediment metagenome]
NEEKTKETFSILREMAEKEALANKNKEREKQSNKQKG